MIQRYGIDHQPHKYTDGDYVLYDDHLATLEAAVKEFENSDAGMLRAVNEGLVEEGEIQAKEIVTLKAANEESYEEVKLLMLEGKEYRKQVAAITAENKRLAEEMAKLRAFWEWSQKADKLLFGREWKAEQEKEAAGNEINMCR